MASPHDTGNVQPELDREEHLHAAEAKRVVPLYLQEGGQYGNELLAGKSGTVATYTNVTVTTGATQIIAANTSRRAITISRGSGARLWIGPDNTVTTSMGIPISEFGGISDSGIGLVTTAWFGVVPTGSLDVTVIEWEA